jgi:hypothetical protein
MSDLSKQYDFSDRDSQQSMNEFLLAGSIELEQKISSSQGLPKQDLPKPKGSDFLDQLHNRSPESSSRKAACKITDNQNFHANSEGKTVDSGLCKNMLNHELQQKDLELDIQRKLIDQQINNIDQLTKSLARKRVDRQEVQSSVASKSLANKQNKTVKMLADKIQKYKKKYLSIKDDYNRTCTNCSQVRARSESRNRGWLALAKYV